MTLCNICVKWEKEDQIWHEKTFLHQVYLLNLSIERIKATFKWKLIRPIARFLDRFFS